MRRLAPRSLEAALADVTSKLAPATTLGQIQAVWRDAVGERVDAEAQPASERDGTVTVACRDAVWAQELDLMGSELAQRVNEALGSRTCVRRLRFVVRT